MAGHSRQSTAGQHIHFKPELSSRFNPDSIPADVLIYLSIAILLYLATRLVALGQAPLPFYSDEAVPVIRAEELLRNSFRNNEFIFLPAFFQNDGQHSLGVTVYLQLFALLLSGKSIFTARAVSVFVGLLGVVWFSLTLVRVLRLRHAWLGAFLLVAAPAWLLFSRRALETPVMAAFYAGFIYYYLLYRLRNPRYLVPALILGALAFYSYNAGQVVMAALGTFLLILDAPYHWQQRKTTLRGLALLVLLALPWLRFCFLYPDEYTLQLGNYSSFLLTGVSLPEKIATYLGHYLYALSPIPWFSAAGNDPTWWTLKGYSPISWFLAPFWAWGFVLVLRNLRKPEMRILLAAYLAGPAGAAAVGIGITRILMMLIPALLITTLGLCDLLERLFRRFPREKIVLPSLAALLAISSLGMTANMTLNSPAWSTEYGLETPQWGSPEVFDLALELQQEYPATNLFISGNWSWKPEIMLQFFVPASAPVYIANADAFMRDVREDLDHTIFILSVPDYRNALASGLFQSADLLRVIKTPGGAPAFYAVRFAYIPNVAVEMAARDAEHNRMVSETVLLNGRQVVIQHTRFDVGEAALLFDADPGTCARTASANPMVVEWDLPAPQTISGVQVRIGSEYTRVTLTITGSNGEQIVQTGAGFVAEDIRDFTLLLEKPVEAVHLRIEINDYHLPKDAHVHLWEIKLISP